MFNNILGSGFRVPYGNVEQIGNLALSGFMVAFCFFGGIALFSKIYQEVRAAKKDRMTTDYGWLLLAFCKEIEEACQLGTIQDVWRAMFKLEVALNKKAKKASLLGGSTESRVQTLRKELPELGIDDSIVMNHEAKFSVFFANTVAPFLGLSINEHKGFININRLPESVRDTMFKLCERCEAHIKNRRIRREQAVEEFEHHHHSSSDDEFSIDQMVGRKPRRKKKTKKNSR